MDGDKAGMFADRETGKSLGEMLVEENIITSEQLEGALELQRRQGGRLSEILISRELVKAEELATVLSIQLNMPLIDLKRHMVQPGALRLIPEDITLFHSISLMTRWWW
jgi:hypothetical protein